MLGDTQVTAPAAVVLKCRYWPLAARMASSGSPSWQVANSTFMLRARTLTWDSTSGASGVSTATQPSGISSSPGLGGCVRWVVGGWVGRWVGGKGDHGEWRGDTGVRAQELCIVFGQGHRQHSSDQQAGGGGRGGVAAHRAARVAAPRRRAAAHL